MENEKQDLFNSIALAIVVPLISIGTTIFAKYIGSITGSIVSTIIILLCIALFIVLSSYFCWICYFYVMKGQFDAHIKATIEKTREELENTNLPNGIYKEDQLALMERTGRFNEIWLISPDLSTEIEDGIYNGVVKSNLRKGTKYKYFVPKNDVNAHRVNIFWEDCNRNKNLEIYYLTNDFFFLVPDIDFAIYEPMSKQRIGYMGLAIDCTSDRVAVSMNSEFVDALSSKLESCMTVKALG